MLFSRYKKTLNTVANGKIIPLEAVNDEVFSAKMMGEGFAVTQHDGRVYAPVEGKIINIFPTLHAITLKTKAGDTLLIHMGLDTVELKGRPFSIKVTEGETVTKNTLLAVIDLPQLKEANKDATIIVVLPDIQKAKLIKRDHAAGIEEVVFKF